MITTIISIATIIGLCFSTYFFIDTRYAKCADVKQLENRLDYKIENDKLMAIQQRTWQLEGHYPQITQAPPDIQQQYKELKSDLEMQRNKVQKMEAK